MSNAADGYLGDWLPHKDKCRCTDFELERANTQIRILKAQLHDEALAFNHANEVVGELEAQLSEAQAKLAQMDWTQITPDNLPKVGDEVIYGNGKRVCSVTREYDFTVWKATGDTHFRPINLSAAQERQ